MIKLPKTLYRVRLEGHGYMYAWHKIELRDFEGDKHAIEKLNARDFFRNEWGVSSPDSEDHEHSEIGKHELVTLFDSLYR